MFVAVFCLSDSFASTRLTLLVLALLVLAVSSGPSSLRTTESLLSLDVPTGRLVTFVVGSLKARKHWTRLRLQLIDFASSLPALLFPQPVSSSSSESSAKSLEVRRVFSSSFFPRTCADLVPAVSAQSSFRSLLRFSEVLRPSSSLRSRPQEFESCRTSNGLEGTDSSSLPLLPSDSETFSSLTLPPIS